MMEFVTKFNELLPSNGAYAENGHDVKSSTKLLYCNTRTHAHREQSGAVAIAQHQHRLKKTTHRSRVL